MNYVALDVETANNRSGSICSIGLARFEANTIVESFYTLVKPPDEFGEFDWRCVKVHGITKDEVLHAPSFAAIYEQVEPFILNTKLVAHNASFDSRHLRSSLFLIGEGRSFNMECTLSMARQTLSLPNYRLNTVCEYLGIELVNHHNALDDAIACGMIYGTLSVL